MRIEDTKKICPICSRPYTATVRSGNNKIFGYIHLTLEEAQKLETFPPDKVCLNPDESPIFFTFLNWS
jgi:hypothetical protein